MVIKMKRASVFFITVMLGGILFLSGCGEVVAEPDRQAVDQGILEAESAESGRPNSDESEPESAGAGTTETESPADEVESLTGWTGIYSGSQSYSDGSFVGISLAVYGEDGKYFGYLYMYGYKGQTSCESDMLTEIRGTKDGIQVFLTENLSDEEERGDLFPIYKKGELLFSIQKEGDQPHAIWAEPELGEWLENLEPELSGYEKSLAALRSVKIWDGADETGEVKRLALLRVFGFTEKAAPFYQYYDEEGALQLELFYDMEKRIGMGFLYGEYGEGKTVIHTFAVGEYEQEEYDREAWHNNKFSVKDKNRDASTLKEYAEYSTYNDQGQLTRFYSEGIIEGWGNSPYMGEAVDIEFIYREDGTLERKNSFHSQYLFGTTRDSERFFYDTDERLVYVNSYITHGYLADYYIYEGDSEVPAFCLMLDYASGPWVDGFIKYNVGDQEAPYSSLEIKDTSVGELPAETEFRLEAWKDSYTEFLQGVTTYGYQKRDYIVPGSYDTPPLFCLHNIDNDKIPELIVISDDGYWEESSCDIYTYKDNNCQWVGSIKFNWFGNIGAPVQMKEGIFSDDTYKGHYGSLYYYTIKDNMLMEQLVREYNYRQAPDNYSYLYTYDNNGEKQKISAEDQDYDSVFRRYEYKNLEFYQITKQNLEKIIS